MADITIITPTTGKASLDNLIDSITAQSVEVEHLLLWDDVRDAQRPVQNPAIYDSPHCHSIVIRGSIIQGKAAGSALRAIGLMSAQSKWVATIDDDCWLEPNHLSSMLTALQDRQWGFCLRKVWSPFGGPLGIDRFESIGETMCDGNTMVFQRRLGVLMSPLYRETTSYSDDRVAFRYLTRFAGLPGKSNLATINQTCPARLENMFRMGCSPD